MDAASPGSGLLLRAACNVTRRGPINVPQEAMYWTTSKDGSGHRLSGTPRLHATFCGRTTSGPTMRSGHSLWATRAIALYPRILLTDIASAIALALCQILNGSVDIYIQHTSSHRSRVKLATRTGWEFHATLAARVSARSNRSRRATIRCRRLSKHYDATDESSACIGFSR